MAYIAAKVDLTVDEVKQIIRDHKKEIEEASVKYQAEKEARHAEKKAAADTKTDMEGGVIFVEKDTKEPENGNTVNEEKATVTRGDIIRTITNEFGAPTNIIHHGVICRELEELYKKKNADYGDSFHKSYEEFGNVMAAIRMSDKLNRFKALIKADAQVKDESVRDTMLDLANYAIMTVMELDGRK